MPGTPLRTSPSVLLKASYHKEHEYIWFRGGERGGYLNVFGDIKDFRNWLGPGMLLSQPLNLGFQISNVLAKLCYAQ